MNLRLFANVITHPLFVWLYIDILLALQYHSFLSFVFLFLANILFPAILFSFYLNFRYHSHFPTDQLIQMDPEDRLVLIAFSLIGVSLSPTFLSFLANFSESVVNIQVFWGEWLLSLLFLLLISLFCTPSLHLYAWALLFAYYIENQWIEFFSWTFFLWLAMILIIWVLRWLEGHHSLIELLLGFVIGFNLLFYKKIIFYLVG